MRKRLQRILALRAIQIARIGLSGRTSGRPVGATRRHAATGTSRALGKVSKTGLWRGLKTLKKPFLINILA
jgi:hypothetical protein